MGTWRARGWGRSGHRVDGLTGCPERRQAWGENAWRLLNPNTQRLVINPKNTTGMASLLWHRCENVLLLKRRVTYDSATRGSDRMLILNLSLCSPFLLFLSHFHYALVFTD